MKYKKADDIFPEELLREIQKYVKGEMVYISNPGGIRKGWGENSGNREYLQKRNLVQSLKYWYSHSVRKPSVV